MITPFLGSLICRYLYGYAQSKKGNPSQLFDYYNNIIIAQKNNKEVTNRHFF